MALINARRSRSATCAADQSGHKPSSRRRPGSTVQPLVPLTSGSRLSPGRWLTAERHAPASSPTLSRRRIALAIVGLALMGAGAAAGATAMAAEEKANGNLCIENASLAELQQSLAEERTTASALTRAYLARIEAYDRAGPNLHAVREVSPDVPGLDDKGVPVVSPGGSSSGSAVAVAAGLAAAAIGTETSGSLLSPATQNGVVTVKPTVGLISRTGILPIAHSQDTAGPLTRTVRDAAILLNVLAGPDPRDPATLPLKRPPDYTKFLDENGLKGARIGVPSDPSDPANDFYYRSISPRAHAVIGEVIATLEAQGATIVRANIPTEGWIGGPGTGVATLNPNPESRTKYDPARRSGVLVD